MIWLFCFKKNYIFILSPKDLPAPSKNNHHIIENTNKFSAVFANVHYIPLSLPPKQVKLLACRAC